MIDVLDPTGLQFLCLLLFIEIQKQYQVINNLSSQIGAQSESITILEARIEEIKLYLEQLHDSSEGVISDSEGAPVKSVDITFTI